MKRIGIAASKISKGNIFLYHFFVVFISFLFSLSIFITAGTTVMLALALIGYVATEVVGREFQKDWHWVVMICMVVLTVVIALFNIFAIVVNIRVPQKFFGSRKATLDDERQAPDPH